MTVQLLISTMNQTDYSLVEKMNIFTDAIVINQCNCNSYCEFEYSGHKVKWYDCNERGVGKSRNKALMAADADICVFADDDMVYVENALQVVKEAFGELVNADIISFNVEGLVKSPGIRRLHTWNAFKHGACRLAVRRKKVLQSRVFFSLLFGGGAEFSCGEDTLFLLDCLKSGLRMYETSQYLGRNTCGESTWFQGYTEKFFVDRGVLFYSMNPRLAKIYSLRYVLLKHKLYGESVSRKQAWKWLCKGIECGRRMG